ncbi:general transcription factor II-I repeat domain-containing protein 2-like [Tachypleus tridentatus]|uniref:general transcription factor II-I repeat domain-containing protein 2-like n=1 Tax=Tachypleus tridentatus TaxID=6853 RepID=UPI003FD429A5
MGKVFKKRKIDYENIVYQKRWELDYLITNNNGKLQCLVCMQIISVSKEFNVKRHYSTMIEGKYQKYEGETRKVQIAVFSKRLKQETSMFSKLSESQTSALNASYIVSLELARAKKPFIDGTLIKKCVLQMAEVFRDAKIAEKFESVPPSNQTIQRRVTNMGEQLENQLVGLVEKSADFLLCLDESTDQADVNQLLIFVCIIHEDFSTKEKLLNVCALRGTTKGKDIFEALKDLVDKIGSFNKC